MQEFAFHDLTHKKKLQQLQNELCKVTNVSIYCLDSGKNKVTEISGIKQDLSELSDNCKEAINAALGRVEDGSLEEMAIEEVENENIKVAAIAISIIDETMAYWVVIQNEPGGNETEFYDVLDLLRDASNILFSVHVSYFSAEAESRRSRCEQEEMSRNLRTIEATTSVVQLLDSDEPIEVVIETWLKILGEHLGVDAASVFSLHPQGETMDVICQWINEGHVSIFDQTSNIYAPTFLRITKPLVISSDGNFFDYQTELNEYNVKAVMVFPVVKNENGSGMVLVLSYMINKHTWSMNEIKFASDAVKIFHSVIAKRIQKNSLASSFAALEAILDNVGCAIYVTAENDGRMLFANKRLQSIFAKELHDNTFKDLIDCGKNIDGAAYDIYHANSNKWYDMICKEISWVDGSRAKIYSLYDITDKKVYQRKIEQQAYTDFLTGLYNRMCCERDLARQIDEAKKNNLTGALLYMDLDDFKHINDGLGHQYGDVLLKSISNSLKKIDGIHNTCYRMGGDEFVIVVPPEYYSKFEMIIENIKKIFAEPWFLKDADYYCTMSMGIVTFPDSGDSVQDLIKKADIAMYEAKKTGKNRVSIYRDGIDSVSGRRLDMEKNMRDATVKGYKEFEVYYQPIINVENGGTDCAGAEALIRWNSEKLGCIPPAEFIPLAEYLGLINPIGNYVLKEACKRCKDWNDNGHPDYKVNVNLSVIQLLQTDIVEIVEKTLKETQIIPKNLTLEVTESLAINDMDRMKEILSKIKALGVKIALDDFGTGYSSLNHIREIPFDVIKVDQSFVKDLAEDAYSQSFVKMVAELGETIGVSICVEGIETKKQYNVLKDMKVKYIQGYYFDRPMKCEAFEEKYVSALEKSDKTM